MAEKLEAEILDPSNVKWRRIQHILQVTVFFQSLGNWRWLSIIGETPILSMLLGPADVGGFEWNEATALVTQNVLGWATLVAGLIILWRPITSVLVALFLLQALFAVAMWRTDYGFSLQASWLPPALGNLFPYLAQSSRMAAPLGLLLLVTSYAKNQLQPMRITVAVTIMRWAIAITFIAHGIEALMHHPPFIDLMIGSAWNLLGSGLSQSGVERLLTIIGVLDVIVAILCVTTKNRGVLWWMAAWGAITAVSRITAMGWDNSWHKAFTRVPHMGVPIAIVLLWHLLAWSADKEKLNGENQHKLLKNIEGI